MALYARSEGKLAKKIYVTDRRTRFFKRYRSYTFSFPCSLTVPRDYVLDGEICTKYSDKLSLVKNELEYDRQKNECRIVLNCFEDCEVLAYSKLIVLTATVPRQATENLEDFIFSLVDDDDDDDRKKQKGEKKRCR